MRARARGLRVLHEVLSVLISSASTKQPSQPSQPESLHNLLHNLLPVLGLDSTTSWARLHDVFNLVVLPVLVYIFAYVCNIVSFESFVIVAYGYFAIAYDMYIRTRGRVVMRPQPISIWVEPVNYPIIADEGLAIACCTKYQ
jgi:hypothetical protein